MIRFFAGGAATVALRNGIILFAALVLSLAVLPIPNVALFFRLQMLDLVGTSGSLALGLGFAGLGMTLATQAGPALRLGMGGWLRSLPVSSTEHRRAMAVALVVVQLPLVMIVAASVGAAIAGFREPIAPVRVAGLLTAVLLAGAVGVPVTRSRLARPIAMVGSLTALLGWAGIAASLSLGFIWDRFAGPVAVPRDHATGWDQQPRRLQVTIAWRALGVRMLTVMVVPLVCCGAALAYRINNDLTVAQAGPVTRGLILMAAVLSLAGMADLLVTRRPAWPWARSLPVGSRARVLDDAITAALPTGPTLLIALGLDWRAGCVAIAAVPAFALLATGAMRRAPSRLSRASGEFLVTGTILALAITWWPSLTMAALAGIPLFWWHAARADQRLVVTQWQSLHHHAGGDSLAGDAR